ncbi:MAG: hypothetical protein JSV80_00975 [Acidobacteriota bacterium]|nr:MAG: hypothetical protein JSV80_00975 [Acidobacteriota bacterium]
MDEIFLLQAHRDNPGFRARLEELPREAREDALAYFAIQYGLYERQHGWKPWVSGVPDRPPGGGFYPSTLTKDEWERFLDEHPDREPELVSLTTMVVRDGEQLSGVPYSRYFADPLEAAAAKLARAGALTRDASLRTYLTTLAESLRNNDYRAADLAWMDLEGQLELTFGPYEVYEDELFNYKAAFESFVTLVDPVESARLEQIKSLLPAMERHLPIPDEHKNLSRGTASPIRVTDLVFNAGDARAGIQTIAFNLPNDEEVREQKGSKKVLLRNVIGAKFRTILKPIAERVLTEEQQPHLSERSFFDLVLFHELSHGLGPGHIEVDGQRGEVREFLREHYSTMEEAKADIVGLWNLLYMIERGDHPEEARHGLYATYVAGLVRSARFGGGSAHGRGAAVQFRLLREADAIEIDASSGRLRPQPSRFVAGVREVARRLLMLQAEGRYDETAALLATHASPSPEMQRLIDGLGGVPIDIRPIFPLAGESAATLTLRD